MLHVKRVGLWSRETTHFNPFVCFHKHTSKMTLKLLNLRMLFIHWLWKHKLVYLLDIRWIRTCKWIRMHVKFQDTRWTNMVLLLNKQTKWESKDKVLQNCLPKGLNTEETPILKGNPPHTFISYTASQSPEHKYTKIDVRQHVVSCKACGFAYVNFWAI